MVKNRTMQLVYQTVYCTVGFIGVVASFDFLTWLFSAKFTYILLIELVNVINSEEKYLELQFVF